MGEGEEGCRSLLGYWEYTGMSSQRSSPITWPSTAPAWLSGDLLGFQLAGGVVGVGVTYQKVPGFILKSKIVAFCLNILSYKQVNKLICIPKPNSN